MNPSNAARFTRILAPVDFSKPCIQSLSAAVSLARRCGANLPLLNVVKHLPHDSQVVRKGKPFVVIVREAAELGCDWILKATIGYNRLAHVLIGSTAERVVRNAACSERVVG
jgi:nucleotide-binding universal stress UspA family protein